MHLDENWNTSLCRGHDHTYKSMWCCNNVGGLGEHMTCHPLFLSIPFLLLLLYSSAHAEPTSVDQFWWSIRSRRFCAKTAPHLGDQIPQIPILRAWIGVLKPNSQLAYYQNYCIDSNQILHNDKDHQMPFVGGRNTCIINPRWRMATILEKSKNHISAMVWLTAMKFGTVTQFDPLDHSDH